MYNNNAETIGKTPMVRLANIWPAGNIYAKLESRNPAGSVKCRIGAAMIWAAEESGELKPGMTLVEPTSGNTGIALAFVAAAKGYRLILTMPASMSLERRKVMKALGAEIILTEPTKGMNGAIAKAEELLSENPDQYLMLQQFKNPANPAIHEKTTGPEIWQDSEGQIDVLVAGVGTGGTLSGVTRYIKITQGKAIAAIAVEPVDSPVITQTLNGETPTPAPHKIQGIGAGFVPDNLDTSLVDGVEQVTNEEAINTARLLMRKEGILAGISCGAALQAALNIAEKPEYKDQMIVVILPDSGERYLSSILFEGIFSDNETVQ